ncbi:FAD-binding monooxygenase ausC [Colletotrichum siamense]|uniref:FAD-binding monooxygenase ausC n=1 Tax=Colletotrichum siamense TaxID=690259 RepID=UPI00187272F4|nr:FAD-binding monooxygenase ausC [Colletotrichum siamense]KAF5501119.1 FAD-binding monooxygenase ausC [Colletotrichum siamense]
MAADLQSLQQKYIAEAQKRLRPNGTDQFQDARQSESARIRGFAEDIWADHATLDTQLSQSPALKAGDRTKFLIAGAGIGGIVSAVRLILAGFDVSQIRLVETAGGVGGTWYWNRYPGLHCDVESYVYLPLLEEMGYMPSHKYTSGVEIRNYLNQIVQRFQLQDKILFRTKLDRIEWNEEKSLWKADLTTARGTADCKELSKLSVQSEFVIFTAGYLSRPQVPKFADLDAFTGSMFHTARWDYSVTGGSDEEPFPSLDKLRGKSVAIIGTGATAIQVVPCLAKYAGEVFVFQRTPSAVYSRGQQATDPHGWVNGITSSPGWHKKRMENMSAHMARSAQPGAPDLVSDEWTRQSAYAGVVGDPEWAYIGPGKVPELIAHYLKLDADNRAKLRERVSDIVKDKSTSEKLTPWYPVWCKRPAFSDTYLQTFNMPHVHLVDTEGHGVDKATPNGLVVQGFEYKLDVLVLATGYVSPSTAVDPAARAGVEVYGRKGRPMAEKWEAQGLTTLHGVASNGFPNLFWIGASQGPSAANLGHVIDAQSRHIAHIIAQAHHRADTAASDPSKFRACVVEVDIDAEDAWSLRVMQGATRLAVTSVCTPGYLNNEGQGLRMTLGLEKAPSPDNMAKAARAAPWSAGMPSYLHEIEAFQAEGELRGFTVSAT